MSKIPKPRGAETSSPQEASRLGRVCGESACAEECGRGESELKGLNTEVGAKGAAVRQQVRLRAQDAQDPGVLAGRLSLTREELILGTCTAGPLACV